MFSEIVEVVAIYIYMSERNDKICLYSVIVSENLSVHGNTTVSSLLLNATRAFDLLIRSSFD